MQRAVQRAHPNGWGSEAMPVASDPPLDVCAVYEAQFGPLRRVGAVLACDPLCHDVMHSMLRKHTVSAILGPSMIVVWEEIVAGSYARFVAAYLCFLQFE